MGWKQITVLTTTEAADWVSETLLEAGSGGTMIEDRNDIAANQRPEGRWDIIDEAIALRMGEDVKVTGWLEDAEWEAREPWLREQLDRIRSEMGDAAGKLSVTASVLQEEDWAESWKQTFSPIRLGQSIVICPTWAEFEPEPGDRVIAMDPGMAFGTGTHETTAMCAALVEKYVRPGSRVIDIGTGSGILAMAAAKMGASHVLATDLDPVAVRVAAENIEANGLAGKITTRCGDLLEVVEESGDVVIANIIADAILLLAEPVRSRIVPGGIFICSGISADRREDVRTKLQQLGYELLDAPVRGEWAAFAARKR